MNKQPEITDRNVVEYVAHKIYEKVHDNDDYYGYSDVTEGEIRENIEQGESFDGLVQAYFSDCLNDFIKVERNLVEPPCKVGDVTGLGICKEIDRDSHQVFIHSVGARKWYSYEDVAKAMA